MAESMLPHLPIHPQPQISEQSLPVIAAEQFVQPEEASRGTLGRVGEFIHRQRVKLAVGATALSVGATLALDPMGETIDRVADVAPWIGGGVAVSETMFVAGAGMMLGAVGKKVGNPFKIKEQIPEIATRANSSKLFKAGFWINTAGAVGDFLAVAPAVVTKMPVHSWGIIPLTLVDLGVTYGVRRTIWNGVKQNALTDDHVSEV